MGPHTARQILPHWIVVRARVASRGRLLPYPGVTLAFGRDALELPSFSAEQPEGLAAAVAERGPEGASSITSPFCDKAGWGTCLFLLPLSFCPKWSSSDWARGGDPACLVKLVPMKLGATSNVVGHEVDGRAEGRHRVAGRRGALTAGAERKKRRRG